MEVVKTRDEVADFLAKIRPVDFPLSIEQTDPSCLVISNGRDEPLCHYLNEDKNGVNFPFPSSQKIQLENIALVLSEEALAVADDNLRPTQEECKKFRDIIRKIWNSKEDNDLVSPKSVMTQAKRRNLPRKLVVALLGRLAKSGIMPLHRITRGKNYYDRRFYQQPHKLQEFFNMGLRSLVQCLAPSPVHSLPAPITVEPPPVFPGLKHAPVGPLKHLKKNPCSGTKTG